MAGKKIRYVQARSLTKRLTLVHEINSDDPDITNCGRIISHWPWRYYPTRPDRLIVCMQCTREKLDWEELRS